MTDYHTKPVLSARVDAEVKAWARDEATRRGQALGDFLNDLLVAERDRCATNLDCPHPKARVNKGLCGACGTYVGQGGKP